MYLTDPTTKTQSVTLTFVIVTFILATGFCVAAALSLIKEPPSSLMDLFYSCAALYFGRRFSVGGKTFDANKTNQPNGDAP